MGGARRSGSRKANGPITTGKCGLSVVARATSLGNIPSEKDCLLYKWRVLFENNTTVNYITSVPLLQTDTFEKEGTLKVYVVISNKGTVSGIRA
ncbi:hypothetical protein NPIL_472642 [Nephila pilipes]|uniref:Uncharacterized protein n=1 Tax=Nephila pilipes TaxID=299642 RepID=A0A8X6U6C6_NEPPI|nr:hypothetical protein NPIL_472642 [Nephila pilipes]